MGIYKLSGLLMFVNTYETVQQFEIGRKRKVNNALNLKRSVIFSAKSKAVSAYKVSDIKLKKKKKMQLEKRAEEGRGGRKEGNPPFYIHPPPLPQQHSCSYPGSGYLLNTFRTHIRHCYFVANGAVVGPAQPFFCDHEVWLCWPYCA